MKNKKALKLLVTLFAFIQIAFADDVYVEKLDVNAADIAIQAAIDKCSTSGGGIVYLPSKSGAFMCSSIELKSGVMLNIPKNVTLRAKVEGTARKKFIFAQNAENVGVCGYGTIDGNGDAYGCVPEQKAPRHPNRAHLLRFDFCKNVRVESVKILNSSSWTINLFRCDTVFIDKVLIRSLSNHNNDGIDIGSKNVVISNSVIESGDDAICFKTHSREQTIENVVISNCVLSSNCNIIKTGTASFGNIRNVTISNCTMNRTSASKIFDWRSRRVWANISEPISALAGIAIIAVDGGSIESVTISNITMRGIQTPIFIRVGDRKNFVETQSLENVKIVSDTRKSSVKNIVVNSLVADSVSSISNSITAVSGQELKNVIIRDAIITMRGLPDSAEAEKSLKKKIGERASAYPENDMFKILPAYGFYTRNVQNLRFENVQISYTGNEYRPAFVFDNSDVYLRNCIWRKANSNVDNVISRFGSKVLQVGNIETEK